MRRIDILQRASKRIASLPRMRIRCEWDSARRPPIVTELKIPGVILQGDIFAFESLKTDDY
jgi:hypothetical protein